MRCPRAASRACSERVGCAKPAAGQTAIVEGERLSVRVLDVTKRGAVAVVARRSVIEEREAVVPESFL